jgi:hypothetical protein
MKKIICITGFGLVILYSCSKDSNGGSGGGGSSVNCSTITNKAFAADIAPIIAANCATSTSCHASGSANGPGALTNYSQISGAASMIKTAVSTGRMPQGSSLSSAQKNSIICWVDSGAPNN